MRKGDSVDRTVRKGLWEEFINLWIYWCDGSYYMTSVTMFLSSYEFLLLIWTNFPSVETSMSPLWQKTSWDQTAPYSSYIRTFPVMNGTIILPRKIHIYSEFLFDFHICFSFLQNYWTLLWLYLMALIISWYRIHIASYSGTYLRANGGIDQDICWCYHI